MPSKLRWGRPVADSASSELGLEIAQGLFKVDLSFLLAQESRDLR